MDIYELNKQAFVFINQHMQNPVLDFLVLWILIPLFSLLPLTPIFFVFFKEHRNLGLFSVISALFIYLLGHFLLKPLFNIPRPSTFIEGTRILGPFHESPYSFPSTTTMLAFSFAFPIFFEKKRVGSILLILAILVGFSVIYSGFHTPLDVIAGILFSFLFSFILRLFFIKWIRQS